MSAEQTTGSVGKVVQVIGPVVDVEFTGEVAKDTAQRLADALGEVFGSPPAETWVKVHTLEQHRYAENHSTLAAGIRPVWVKVLKGTAPVGDEAAVLALSIADAVAAACRLPVGNIHVIFEPDALGRVAFGGRLAGR